MRLESGSTAGSGAADALQAARYSSPAHRCQRSLMRISADRDDLLAELETRQDEVLCQLDALDARLESCWRIRSPPPQKPQPLAMPP